MRYPIRWCSSNTYGQQQPSTCTEIAKCTFRKTQITKTFLEAAQPLIWYCIRHTRSTNTELVRYSTRTVNNCQRYHKGPCSYLLNAMSTINRACCMMTVVNRTYRQYMSHVDSCVSPKMVFWNCCSYLLNAVSTITVHVAWWPLLIMHVCSMTGVNRTCRQLCWL